MTCDRTPGFLPRARPVLAGSATAALFVALVVLISHAVTTSSARVAATTSSGGMLTAATVSFARPGGAATVFFDADELYPGAVTSGCTMIRYDGSVPAELRLWARPGDGSGLDAFVDLVISVRPDDDCTGYDTHDDTDDEIRSGRRLYDGRLATFWRTHSDFESGLAVVESMQPGDTFAVGASAVIVDDNRAGGLDTELSFSFEGRPT